MAVHLSEWTSLVLQTALAALLHLPCKSGLFIHGLVLGVAVQELSFFVRPCRQFRIRAEATERVIAFRIWTGQFRMFRKARVAATEAVQLSQSLRWQHDRDDNYSDLL